MPDRILRFRDLKERGLVFNWPTINRWIEWEGFPPGRLIAANTRVWTESEIETWLASRPTARKQMNVGSK